MGIPTVDIDLLRKNTVVGHVSIQANYILFLIFVELWR